MLHKIRLCGFASLSDKLAVVGNPRALLFENLLLDAEVDEAARHRNAFVVHNVEFAFRKRRRNLVLYNLDFRAVADDLARRVFNLSDSADVDAHRGEELEGASAGGCLGIAEHHADFFADLVRENAYALCLADCGGEAAHGLTHHAGLETHRCVAHLPVEFLTRNERGNGVDYDNVDCARADERFGDVERVFAAFGLRDHQVFEVYAHDLRILGVERVFHVDEDGVAALALGFGYERKTERCFARRFGPVNFDDSAARQAAHAESQVYRDRARADCFDVHLESFAEPYERAFAELLVNHSEGCFEGFVVFVYNSCW